jgi:hypothetical protein
MNVMSPGAIIDQELRRLGDNLEGEARLGTTTADGKDGKQYLTEKRGIFELRLAQYLGLFTLTCHINKDWRLEVFRGETPPSDEIAAALRGVFERWLTLNDHFRQRLEYFEHHGPPLGNHALHLRLYADEAHKLLHEWRAPGLSLSPALRVQRFSPEAAAKLQEILSPHKK